MSKKIGHVKNGQNLRNMAILGHLIEYKNFKCILWLEILGVAEGRQTFSCSLRCLLSNDVPISHVVEPNLCRIGSEMSRSPNFEPSKNFIIFH